MIHEIAVDVGTELVARGFPLKAIPIIDGPERRPTTTFGRERIVFEEDRSGDQFDPRHRADTNPRTLFTRKQGVKVTIYAQHPNKGATYWEHRRRADHILDLVLVCLFVTAKKRGNLIVYRSGKFADPPDLEKSETPGGAVYELQIFFDRGVADRKWDGTAQPTTVVSAVAPDTGPGVVISNSTQVSGSTEDGGPSTETV